MKHASAVRVRWDSGHDTIVPNRPLLRDVLSQCGAPVRFYLAFGLRWRAEFAPPYPDAGDGFVADLGIPPNWCTDGRKVIGLECA